VRAPLEGPRGWCNPLGKRSCFVAPYLLSPLFPRSAPGDLPDSVLRALVAPLPIVTAALGCLPWLRTAVKRPRICPSVAAFFFRDLANSWVMIGRPVADGRGGSGFFSLVFVSAAIVPYDPAFDLLAGPSNRAESSFSALSYRASSGDDSGPLKPPLARSFASCISLAAFTNSRSL
jgi:hypothetical protein